MVHCKQIKDRIVSKETMSKKDQEIEQLRKELED